MTNPKSRQDIERLQDALVREGLGHIEVKEADGVRKHAWLLGDYADILLARKAFAGWRIDRAI